MPKTLHDAPKAPLTPREHQVLLMLVTSVLTAEEIASVLAVSKRTVDFHTAAILEKTRSASRIELIQRSCHLTLKQAYERAPEGK